MITTFFSYKGGAGRSTTCLNTVPFLAEKTRAFARAPIILIDMDIESAGMTYLLNEQDTFVGKFDVKILLKNEEPWSANNYCELFQHPFYEYLVPVGHKLGLADDRAVMFLGVDDTSDQLNRDDIEGRLKEVMNKLRRFARSYRCQGIVMDSAAGDQVSAQLAVEFADKIAFCMRMTHQFRIGTFNYLNKLSLRYQNSNDKKEFILLPTVVPADAMIDGQSQMDLSIEDITNRIAKINYLTIHDDFVSSRDRFGINEIMRFKWKENVLYKLKGETDLTADEKEGFARYQALAELICKK